MDMKDWETAIALTWRKTSVTDRFCPKSFRIIFLRKRPASLLTFFYLAV